MNLRWVGPKHYLCDFRDERNARMPKAAHVFLLNTCNADCDGALCVFDRGQLVAFARFWEYQDTLQAAGTWVAPDYRRKGIAKRLWARILNRFPVPMRVDTVSRAGARLGRSLQRKFSRKVVEHHDHSNR